MRSPSTVTTSCLRPELSGEHSLTGVPHIGKATMIGALLGAAAIASPLAAVLISLGGGTMSLVAAVHVGFFAGMGFGGMLGAVIQADRFERAVRHRAPRPSVMTSPNEAGLRVTGSRRIDHAAA